MFKRSRKRIILSIMVPLILLFSLTLSVILFASYRETRQKNAEMLDRYADLYSLDQDPGGQTGPDAKPGGEISSRPEPDGQNDPSGKPLDERPDYQLSTFYSVALAEDGTVLAADNGEKDVYSEEELVRIAEELLAEGRPSGRTGTLSYVVSKRPDYTLVAFMDTTITESSLNMLLRNMLIVGVAAIALLFFISLFLSSRIIRPLEENDRQQKQFISDASHELKTPIAVISTNAEMLRRELGENEWLSNIQYENERMGGLVRQLLELSRAENAETVMEPLDFSRIAAGEALAFESLAFDQGKTIQSDIESGIHITGNRTQLTQLVSVLLDNAIRHSTGSEINVALKQQGHTAVLRVVNDGDEIPPEKAEHLFDRFYRVDEVRNSEGQHYGLGLSIAKAVTEKHGGSIGVSCHDGKVCFTAALPVK